MTVRTGLSSTSQLLVVTYDCPQYLKSEVAELGVRISYARVSGTWIR